MGAPRPPSLKRAPPVGGSARQEGRDRPRNRSNPEPILDEARDRLLDAGPQAAGQTIAALGRGRSPHVLSVACGHLREAGESTAFRRNAFGRLVALDQDPRSLEVVRASLPGSGVETLCGSIKLLLAGAFADQRFDHVYAAGLFDYLDDLLSVSDGIPAVEVGSRNCFQDATGNVGYLELGRA